MKTSDLQIVGREKGKETPVKCIVNIFNKIIGENFSNLKKAMLTKVQEACIKGVPQIQKNMQRPIAKKRKKKKYK